MKNDFMAQLFYQGKHLKQKEKDNIIAMLLPSIFAIALCAVCLMGSTWAWFTASQSTTTQTIQAANYTVSAVVMMGENEITAKEGIYSLEANHTYAVTLTATGDATTGYGVVTIGDTEIYRGQLKPAESVSFTLVVNEGATLTIAYQWGTAAAPNSSIQDGSYTYGTASISNKEPLIENNNGDGDTTESAEQTTPLTEETQPIETPAEPFETESTDTPATAPEVTLPSEAEDSTDIDEIKTEE